MNGVHWYAVKVSASHSRC